MNHVPVISHKNFFKFLFIYSKNLSFLIILIFLIGCSSGKKFTRYNDLKFDESNNIRVLLDNASSDLVITVNDAINILVNDRIIARVNSGNKLRLVNTSSSLNLVIGSKEFNSDRFIITPADQSEIIKINNKKYRGRVNIFLGDSEIKIINQIGLEDYVKGVMTKEMPIGKGNENYNALKAFSICIRTYAYNKLSENKDFFDIYTDTRDQVYGGVDGESDLTNKIVDETKNQILFYENSPAKMFYHSTCGGQTEDVQNVFGKKNIPYLISIKDGEDPFCKISPRFEWTEKFTEAVFINRLSRAKLIENANYYVSDIVVKSRFESGRVNELDIIVNDGKEVQKTIFLSGNSIRSIIRSSDDKSILKSTLFDIGINADRDIIINGKGNGHGVGLCQWGAIGQSRNGIDYKKILTHYFSGTVIKNIYD